MLQVIIKYRVDVLLGGREAAFTRKPPLIQVDDVGPQRIQHLRCEILSASTPSHVP